MDGLSTQLQGMANTHARLSLSMELERGDPDCIENIVANHAAYMEVVERVLGAPPNSLYRADAEAVKVWADAVQGNYQA